MAYLEAEGLHKSFGGLMAIRNVSLKVEEGQMIGLISPKDSDKTTLLNLLAGCFKPNYTTIHFKDQNITSLARCRMNQKGIARTFQLTKAFLEFTALRNVRVGRVYGQHPTRSLKVATDESLGILDLC